MVGSGKHTVRQLIEAQSRRRSAATHGESVIPIDEVTADPVREAGWELDEVLPVNERLTVRRTANLHTGGTICDVTDEVNPTLARVAIEAADITLISGSLSGVVTAVGLSKATMRNIRQNLFFALAYNAIGIPVAAGVLYPWLGLRLSPILAAAAMALSSLSVVTNANRLRRHRPAPLPLPAAGPAAVEPRVEVPAEQPVTSPRPATAAGDEVSIRRHHHHRHQEPATPVDDPVCGMAVSPQAAADSEDADGVTYFFCSAQCAAAFRAEPDRYATHAQHSDRP